MARSISSSSRFRCKKKKKKKIFRFQEWKKTTISKYPNKENPVRYGGEQPPAAFTKRIFFFSSRSPQEEMEDWKMFTSSLTVAHLKPFRISRNLWPNFIHWPDRHGCDLIEFKPQKIGLLISENVSSSFYCGRLRPDLQREERTRAAAYLSPI